ncbi:SDR family NAD(P)-dependent oxidoreductase [Solicola sp. PLA-1-18]|uniref:SDR family NAD(P)-dependent oxidoreductase n=1 Tax=Solicola sp. PLA-1-18 TaxID=3380532 RepID=UPI003B78DD11
MLDYSAQIAGRRVVLTGACGVMGRWMAEAFAGAGADLLLTDRRAEPLQALAAALGAHHVVADLADDGGVDAVLAACDDRWDAPDVVVNNAGIYPRTPVTGTDRELARTVLDVNVLAVFELTRHAATRMVAAGRAGSIVNISSGAAVRPGPGGTVYAASKAAVESLTRGMALELAADGVRVNAVQPGFAPGSEVSDLSDEHVARMLTRIPLGRTSGPTDAASAVLWLCSDDASFVTGATIAVDGGRTAGDAAPRPTSHEGSGTR